MKNSTTTSTTTPTVAAVAKTFMNGGQYPLSLWSHGDNAFSGRNQVARRLLYNGGRRPVLFMAFRDLISTRIERELIGAANAEAVEILRVPFERLEDFSAYEDAEFIYEMIQRFERILGGYTPDMLKRVKARKAFSVQYGAYLQFMYTFRYAVPEELDKQLSTLWEAVIKIDGPDKANRYDYA